MTAMRKIFKVLATGRFCASGCQWVGAVLEFLKQLCWRIPRILIKLLDKICLCTRHDQGDRTIIELLYALVRKQIGCRCCKDCTDWVGDFQTVVDLKDAGLVIYRHTARTENLDKETGDFDFATTTLEDVFILHNTNKSKGLTSVDCIPELEQKKINCPQCRKIMEHAQILLQKLANITGNDVQGICERCKTRGSPCYKCKEVVDKFIAGQSQRKLNTKLKVNQWLSKVQQLLKDAMLSTAKDNLRKRANSELNIHQIFREPQKSSRDPEVTRLFHPHSLDFQGAFSPSIITRKNLFTHFSDEENPEGPLVFLDSSEKVEKPSTFTTNKYNLEDTAKNRSIYRKDRKLESREYIPPDHYKENMTKRRNSSDTEFEKTIRPRSMYRSDEKQEISGKRQHAKDKSYDQENITKRRDSSDMELDQILRPRSMYRSDKKQEVSGKRQYEKDKSYDRNIKSTNESKFRSIIRKSKSNETLSTKGVKKQDFKYVFPKVPLPSKVLKPQKSSSELIKATQDKVFAKTGKEKKRLEEDRKKQIGNEKTGSGRDESMKTQGSKNIEEIYKKDGEKKNQDSKKLDDNKESIGYKSKAKALHGEKAPDNNVKELDKNKKEAPERKYKEAGKARKGSSERREEDADKTMKHSEVQKDKETGKGKKYTSARKEIDADTVKKDSGERKHQETEKGKKDTSDRQGTDADKAKKDLGERKDKETGKAQRHSVERKEVNADKVKTYSGERKDKETGKGIMDISVRKDMDADKAKKGLGERKDKETGKGKKETAERREKEYDTAKTFKQQKGNETQKGKEYRSEKEREKEIQQNKTRGGKEVKQGLNTEDVRAKEKQKDLDVMFDQGSRLLKNFKIIKSDDDLVLQLVKIGEGVSKPRIITDTKINLNVTRKAQYTENKYLRTDSSIELDAECLLIKKDGLETAEIIIGTDIFEYNPQIDKHDHPGKLKGVKPIHSKFSAFDTPPHESDASIPEKQVDHDPMSGVIRYALSDRTFIDKGWTLLPMEKVVRKMNVYRMRPAHPEFDWFEHNKNKRFMTYDSGEKLAEFDDEGRGRWFYRNGRMALAYYDAEELHAQQRFVIYSSGEPDKNGRFQPYTLLATFDFLGNGVVFDHTGKIRLKYNQTEGVVLDRNIGPVSHWKWHTLNDPPILQRVMIETQSTHKDPKIINLGGNYNDDNQTRCDNEDMLAIEFNNFIKEKSKKLSQDFKPFQIKMKALKINENFSLKILDQATVYLIFRDGTTNLKLNIGMVLDHNEIVDTDTAEVGEVANNLETYPARTDSLGRLQADIARVRRFERAKCKRESILIPRKPSESADKLVAATSRPLRQPFHRMPTSRTSTVADCCCTNNSCNIYYNTSIC